MGSLTLGETKGCCSIAYEGLRNERYRFPDQSIWRITEHWATTNSGFKAVIVVPEGRSDVYVMSFAGTDSLLDVAVDLAQVAGQTPRQYSQALIWARMAYSVAGSNFVLSGHSLGGGMAAYCSVAMGCPAFTVNPAPLIGAASLRSLGSNTQITNFIASNEFVSSSPGRNPGTDVVVTSTGGILGVLTDHMLANVAPTIPLPIRI